MSRDSQVGAGDGHDSQTVASIVLESVSLHDLTRSGRLGVSQRRSARKMRSKPVDGTSSVALVDGKHSNRRRARGQRMRAQWILGECGSTDSRGSTSAPHSKPRQATLQPGVAAGRLRATLAARLSVMLESG
jgi:hypothetical protein